MTPSSRILASLLSTLPLALAAAPASADESACGKFDFTQGISCRIETKGGCTANCTPLKFEAGCSGGCTVDASQSCVDTCGTQCIAECNPEALDCFAGCHAECDQPTTDLCIAKHPEADCVNTAKAECDMHCEDSCRVPPSSCKEHCTSCCTGGCATQINFDCDFQCFATLQGGCEVQCEEPSGALFCNGQYVFASDVEGCIAHLATQGINVDVSARGSVTCDLSGCDGVGQSSLGGCSAAPASGGDLGAGALAISLIGLAFGVAGERRRRSHRA